MIIRLGALTAVLLIVAQGVVSYLSAEAFEESLFPEILANAEVAGELVAAQIGYAVSIGIPLDSLVEMDAFLDGVLQRNPDLLFLAVADTEEAVLYARGAEAMPDLSAPDARPNSLELSVPILAESERVGKLRIGVREGSVLEVFSELRFDILTVLLGTLFVAVELLVAFVVVKISGPIQHSYNVLAMGARGNFAYQIGIRSRDEVGKFASAYNAAVRRINNAFAELLNEAEDAQSVQLERSVQERISSIVAEVRARFQFSPPGSEEAVPVRSPMDVRIPLFIFMLSQELSRPFLPLFFDQIYTPIAGLSREVAIGLPITAFMLTALVATPVTGALTDRFAPRAIFLAGAIPSVVGHFGAAFSESIVEVLFWWVLSGLGYGVIFISAQAYVAHHTDRRRRAGGMATFAGAVYAAFVCGPAVGGILADRLGYEWTLVVAGVLAAFSAVVAIIVVDGGAPRGGRAGGSGLSSLEAWARLFANRRFFALTVLSSLPAKLVLAGLYFYLIPLYLFDLENTQSNIGRIMMVYGVACVLITPLAARGSDRHGRHEFFVIAGGLVAGIGCLLPGIEDSTSLVLAAVAVMGVGHALLTAPQLAVIQEIAESAGDELNIGPGAIVGAFRTVERIGTALGAVVVGGIVAVAGFGQAVAITGVISLLCTATYFVLVWQGGELRKAQ